ncbi:MAG: hypothetical protein IKX00_04945 [Bacilli bacterium]|nr:hypothetical protein [Bacilli bacterium]
MKEATGELNMTVITVVAIVAVGAFFYAAIWPRIKSSVTKNTKCSDAICAQCTESNGNRTCTDCVDGDGNNIGTCTYKGAADND